MGFKSMAASAPPSDEEKKKNQNYSFLERLEKIEVG